MLGTYIWNDMKITHRAHSFWDQMVMTEVFFKNVYDGYKKTIDPKIIIDIGANIGCFSLRASYDHKDAKIYAWEPFQENFNLLQININNNNLLKRIKIFEFAVGAENLVTMLKVDTNVFNSGGGHLITNEEKQSAISHVTPVGVMDFESVLNITRHDDIDLVKMNIEGGEYHLLLDNPSEVIKRVKVYVGESHDKNKDEKMFKRMEEDGYVVSNEGQIFLFKRRDIV